MREGVEQTDYGAPQAQFGGSPMGCASSANFATVRIIGSENLGPTICSPTGNLTAVRPAGTLAAGRAGVARVARRGPADRLDFLIHADSGDVGRVGEAQAPQAPRFCDHVARALPRRGSGERRLSGKPGHRI